MEYCITVNAAQSGKTVKTLLRQELSLSHTVFGRLKRTAGGILCNGEPAFANRQVQEGDVLTVQLALVEPPNTAEPVEIPLHIVYEDDGLLVLNKQAPLAVIPSSFAPDEISLANAFAHYWGAEQGFHPVNRLDRGTTGLMVVAKSGHVHGLLQRKLHSGEFLRRYVALVEGCPKPPEGRICQPIGRKDGSAIAHCVTEQGAEAVTDYRVLGQKQRLSLVEVTPQTGRTHQIRIHMAWMGCPLVGDWLYGTEGAMGMERPALHAEFLQLQHPITGEMLQFTAPMAEDIQKVWEQ